MRCTRTVHTREPVRVPSSCCAESRGRLGPAPASAARQPHPCSGASVPLLYASSSPLLLFPSVSTLFPSHTCISSAPISSRHRPFGAIPFVAADIVQPASLRLSRGKAQGASWFSRFSLSGLRLLGLQKGRPCPTLVPTLSLVFCPVFMKQHPWSSPAAARCSPRLAGSPLLVHGRVLGPGTWICVYAVPRAGFLPLWVRAPAFENLHVVWYRLGKAGAFACCKTLLLRIISN